MELLNEKLLDICTPLPSDFAVTHYLYWDKLSDFLVSTNSCYSYSALSWARLALQSIEDNRFDNVTLDVDEIDMDEDFTFDYFAPICYMDLEKLTKTMEGIVYYVFSTFHRKFELGEDKMQIIWKIVAAIKSRAFDLVRIIERGRFNMENGDFETLFNDSKYVDFNGKKLNDFFFYMYDSCISVLVLFQFQLFQWKHSTPCRHINEVDLDRIILYGKSIDSKFLLTRFRLFFFYIAFNIPLMRRAKYMNPLSTIETAFSDYFNYGPVSVMVERLIENNYLNIERGFPKNAAELWDERFIHMTISCVFHMKNAEGKFGRYFKKDFTKTRPYPFFSYNPVDFTWISEVEMGKICVCKNAYEAYMFIEESSHS